MTGRPVALIQHGNYWFAFGDDARALAGALGKRVKRDSDDPGRVYLMFPLHDADVVSDIARENNITCGWVEDV